MREQGNNCRADENWHARLPEKQAKVASNSVPVGRMGSVQGNYSYTRIRGFVQGNDFSVQNRDKCTAARRCINL